MRHPDGRLLYPLMQFDGPQLVPQVDELVTSFAKNRGPPAPLTCRHRAKRLSARS